MSEGNEESGKRSATRARQVFEAATPGTAEWAHAAARYSTTPDGYQHLSEAADTAELAGDDDEAAALRAAINRGETLQQADAETARLANTTRTRARIRLQDDLDAIAAQFGVGDEQVRRDHLISHMLSALTTMDSTDDLTFFGGTALSRTYLPNLRLSEDIDLITKGHRGQTADAIQHAIARRLQRTHGTVDWAPELGATSGSEPCTLTTSEGIRVQLQLLSAEGYPNWPTAKARLIQRYADAPPASLTTLTPTAFAAAKTATWADRYAPRDLYDTWALGEHGYITPETAALYRRHGPTGNNPSPHLFQAAPSGDAWSDALDHQAMIQVGPQEALERVRWFWERATRD